MFCFEKHKFQWLFHHLFWWICTLFAWNLMVEMFECHIVKSHASVTYCNIVNHQFTSTIDIWMDWWKPIVGKILDVLNLNALRFEHLQWMKNCKSKRNKYSISCFITFWYTFKPYHTKNNMYSISCFDVHASHTFDIS
jgi:hypothetical protein